MGISLKNKTLISVEIDARKVLETSFLNDYESLLSYTVVLEIDKMTDCANFADYIVTNFSEFHF